MISKLQAAIYQKLTTELPIAVYDAVPGGASLPYLVLGEDFVADYSTKDHVGENALITIHVFSRHQGMKEVKSIAESVIALLRDGVAINGAMLCYSGLDTMRFIVEDDGIRHGVVKLRFKILRIER
jgi:hypothetical protein